MRVEKLVLAAGLCLFVSISISGGEYYSENYPSGQDTERQDTSAIREIFIDM